MSDPFRFEASAYGPVVAELLATPRLADLGPGRPDMTVGDRLRGFDPGRDLGATVVDRRAAAALHAGLWLYFDFLDESHNVSQDVKTAEGSFWHAIMHRREPDPGNSKYWWRQTGDHPVLDRLRELSHTTGYDYTTPQEFVAYCEQVRGTGTPQEELAKRVQLHESRLLIEHCYRLAVGD